MGVIQFNEKLVSRPKLYLRTAKQFWNESRWIL